MLVASSGEELAQITELMAEGRVRPHLSAVYPFEQIAQALKEVETGKTQTQADISGRFG